MPKGHENVDTGSPDFDILRSYSPYEFESNLIPQQLVDREVLTEIEKLFKDKNKANLSIDWKNGMTKADKLEHCLKRLVRDNIREYQSFE